MDRASNADCPESGRADRAGNGRKVGGSGQQAVHHLKMKPDFQYSSATASLTTSARRPLIVDAVNDFATHSNVVS